MSLPICRQSVPSLIPCVRTRLLRTSYQVGVYAIGIYKAWVFYLHGPHAFLFQRDYKHVNYTPLIYKDITNIFFHYMSLFDWIMHNKFKDNKLFLA